MMRITPALLYLFSTACLFSGETNSKKTHLLESSKTEVSVNIPLANRPGVQRTTPWEKKQFPVKNADGSTYLADGYQATFEGVDKTLWGFPQTNIILLFPTENAGRIWLGAEPGEIPMIFFDTSNEIVACGIDSRQILWATSLSGKEFYSKDFDLTEGNMDKLVGTFYPDFLVWAHYNIIDMDTLIPFKKNTSKDRPTSVDYFSEKVDLIGIAAKEEYIAFLLRDLETSELKARIWFKLRPRKVLGSEIFRRPIGEDKGEEAILGKISAIKGSPNAQRITPWAQKQFQVLDLNGRTYPITGYLAAFNGIRWRDNIKEPTNIIFLFDEKRPGKIWMGLNIKQTYNFIDTGKEIIGCFWCGVLVLEPSLDMTETDKRNLDPNEENMDRLVTAYYPEVDPLRNQSFRIDSYFPKINEWVSFTFQPGSGKFEQIELQKIKAKDGKFGFFFQNMDRPNVKGRLWIQFPEGRVVKAELDEETLKAESPETRSIEVRTNNPLTSPP